MLSELGIEHLGLFIVAGWLLNLTPGPDVLCIVSNGLRHGARAGVVAALGITAGCFVHILAAAVGLGALIAASSTAFTLLKWLGAAYLVVVGLAMMLSRSPMDAINSIAVSEGVAGARGIKDLKSVFVQGFLTNALNPKVALFFVAFLPQFITPDAPNKPLTFALLGLIFTVNAIPINLGYGLGAAWLSRRFAAFQRGMGWLQRGAGALFVFFGVRLALSNPSHP